MYTHISYDNINYYQVNL